MLIGTRAVACKHPQVLQANLTSELLVTVPSGAVPRHLKAKAVLSTGSLLLEHLLQPSGANRAQGIPDASDVTCLHTQLENALAQLSLAGDCNLQSKDQSGSNGGRAAESNMENCEAALHGMLAQV